MEVGQEEAAGKRSQLLGDGRPEHESGITDRQAEAGPRDRSPVQPGPFVRPALGPVFVGSAHVS
jgi:hypothetical protein